jgi:small neutral amino acid transporter SnatA (MarC family)
MEAERSHEIAVFPLAIPLIARPASITAAMLLIGQELRPAKLLDAPIVRQKRIQTL